MGFLVEDRNSIPIISKKRVQLGIGLLALTICYNVKSFLNCGKCCDRAYGRGRIFQFREGYCQRQKEQQQSCCFVHHRMQGYKLLLETYPHMILLILITAITPHHIHNHNGIWIVGNSLNKDTTTKIESAAVSNWFPNLLVLFVFLAIVPSIISLKPQKRYMI